MSIVKDTALVPLHGRGAMPKAVKQAGGRPTKFSDELEGTILTYIRAGAYVETAAIAAGISKNTFYEWLKRGAGYREGKVNDAQSARLLEFSDAVKKAQAISEICDLMIIRKAAERVWQAAAWRLERMFPDRWGKQNRQRVEMGGAVATTNLEPPNLEEFYNRMSRFFGDPDELLPDGSNEPSNTPLCERGDES